MPTQSPNSSTSRSGTGLLATGSSRSKTTRSNIISTKTAHPSQRHSNQPCSSDYTPRPSFTTTLVNSDVNAFDVEADMAFALIASDPNARPKQFRTLFEEYIFVFTAMMAIASTTFIQGVVVINTGTIGRDLSMTSAQVTWIAAAIGLASGSFMLFFSNTADLFGRKLQLLVGLLLLSFSSLLTAFAPNALILNILCGFLGLGTAIIAPPAIGILFAIYPQGKRRNTVTGALGVGNPLGFVLGSISSGIATKYASWRFSFVVIAIFFFILAGATIWTVPAVPRTGNAGILVKQFDYLGTFLTVAGLACLTAALTEAPQLGWHSYKLILLLVIGILCICTFAIWEHHAILPLLPPSIFRDSTFTMSIICVGLGYMSFITNEFWLSLYMQDVEHLAPLHIAVRLMPQAITGVVWSYLGQALISFVSGTVLMGVGGLGYLCGSVLLLFVKPETSYWAFVFPSLCITVIGADFQFIVSNLYISSRLPASQSSLGAGILQTALRLSISSGLAITSAIYGAMSQTPRGLSNPTFPFNRAFLCTVVMASISLLLVPFLHIDRQGMKKNSDEEAYELDAILRKSLSQVSIKSSASTRYFGGRWGDGCSGADAWGFGEGDWKWSEYDRFEVCLECGQERVALDHDHIELTKNAFDYNPTRRI
ncbi:related to aminotriazole resistance protein [Rhynchosporium graminicola]|uniref:Related to aminotriazole resistance protein n=1 Tax=Rhynchosporium graminicola TaxID=2792576 RepID=A0A1E1K1S9_9HELO|nr:related to aminotriazole resistance protein [Rhynchosporium commune]